MRTIYDDLSSIIMDLVVSENLDSLRRGLEFSPARLPFDNCLIIFMASERIKEAIETLEKITKRTKGVTLMT